MVFGICNKSPPPSSFANTLINIHPVIGRDCVSSLELDNNSLNVSWTNNRGRQKLRISLTPNFQQLLERKPRLITVLVQRAAQVDYELKITARLEKITCRSRLTDHTFKAEKAKPGVLNALRRLFGTGGYLDWFTLDLLANEVSKKKNRKHTLRVRVPVKPEKVNAEAHDIIPNPLSHSSTLVQPVSPSEPLSIKINNRIVYLDTEPETKDMKLGQFYIYEAGNRFFLKSFSKSVQPKLSKRHLSTFVLSGKSIDELTTNILKYSGFRNISFPEDFFS